MAKQKTQAVHQQADAPTSPAPVKKKRDQVAEHDLIDAQGAEVDTEETAYGIRYTLLANGASFDYQYGKSGDADRMLACFGAKTLATNETSQARNNAKGAASPDEQIAAVRERFELLSTGIWVDRSREGVGAKIDPDALAEAICQVLVAEGKLEADKVDAYRADRLAKITADKSYATKARTYPPVATAYNAIVGRTVATVDDLLA